MEYASVKIANARVLASVVKKNKLTTVVDLLYPEFSPEECIELMIRGTSFYKFTHEMEQVGFTKPGRVKRHNIKHEVIFA
jgi:hypothetical protein